MATALFTESVQQGHQLYAQGDYEGAERAYTAAVQADPVEADGYRLLSFAQYAQARYELALANSAKAVSLGPDNPENHFARGIAALAGSDLNLAVESLDEVLRLRPDHAHAHASMVSALMARGRKCFENGEDMRGENDLSRAIKLDRTNPEPVQALAKHFLDIDQKTRAIKVVQEALAEMPQDPAVKSMALHLGVSLDAKLEQEAAKRDAVKQAQQKQCPACKAMVMEWASICPRCNTQIAAIPSQFAGRATGPSTTWQEVAYKIVAGLWILNGAYMIFQGVQLRQAEHYLPGMEAYGIIVGAVNAGVGIGLYFESEVVQFIAKLMCYLVILGATVGTCLGMGVAKPFMIAVNLAQLLMACFQLYLLKEVGGD
ncbi:MAG: tetratricopeptide repeat protein [Armatimonadetes bacterium]|nr:tetratricopeptide repeat protein [Armatimonadota bacterium]